MHRKREINMLDQIKKTYRTLSNMWSIYSKQQRNNRTLCMLCVICIHSICLFQGSYIDICLYVFFSTPTITWYFSNASETAARNGISKKFYRVSHIIYIYLSMCESNSDTLSSSHISCTLFIHATRISYNHT